MKIRPGSIVFAALNPEGTWNHFEVVARGARKLN